GSLASRAAERDRAEPPRPARAAEPGTVRADRDRGRPPGARRRRRGAGSLTAELARAGGVLGCAGLAILLVAPTRTLRLGGLSAWALGALVLAIYLLPHGHRPLLAAAAVVGLGLAAGGAWLLRRWPPLLAFAALACFPARIPVNVGSTNANLLVPLYGVVAAAAIALAWELLHGDDRVRELGPLAWPLAAFVAWTGLTILWVADVRQGEIALLFYYLPFGLLAVGFAWLPLRRRFLVIAILASLAIALSTRAARVAAVLAVGIAITWIGLLFSFSQSSFVALIAGVLVAAAFAWQWRVIAAGGLAAVVLVSVGFAAPNIRHSLFDHSFNRVTRDRYSLVTNGLRIAEHQPVRRLGIGCFRQAYAQRP